MARLALKNDLRSPQFPNEWAREFDQMFGAMNRMMGVPGMVNAGECATDVHENEAGYVLTMDMPGVKKEDIRIECTNGSITVRAEKCHEHHLKDSHAHRTERTTGLMMRSFTLPQGVDTDKVQAHLEDGVLQLGIPKAEVAKPKKIKIDSQKGSFLNGIFGSSNK